MIAAIPIQVRRTQLLAAAVEGTRQLLMTTAMEALDLAAAAAIFGVLAAAIIRRLEGLWTDAMRTPEVLILNFVSPLN